MRARARGLALAAALAGAAASLGCSPGWGEPYLYASAAATRAYHEGRYLEAARLYHDAAGKARRVKDRDEALFLEGRMLERAEQWGDAIGMYRALAAASPTGPRTERVLFLAADLELDHGDAAAGWRHLDDALEKHPESGNARAALGRVLEHAAAQGGDAAVVAWLDAHQKAFAPTELDQTVTYERANALERLGRLPEARDAFVSAARAHPYPYGALTDDAFWHAADIEDRLGHYQPAIALLEEMLAPLETSGNPGSYERPRFPAAQERIAEIYRDRLKDHAAARREFHKLYELHRATILRDDALWAEARLAHDDRDAKATCDVVGRLAKEFPESRYARCTRELCPEAPAPKEACAPYIVRQLQRPPGAVDDEAGDTEPAP